MKHRSLRGLMSLIMTTRQLRTPTTLCIRFPSTTTRRSLERLQERLMQRRIKVSGAGRAPKLQVMWIMAAPKLGRVSAVVRSGLKPFQGMAWTRRLSLQSMD